MHKAPQKPDVTEVSDEDDSSSQNSCCDDHDHDHEHAHGGHADGTTTVASKYSRNEKKARKALIKLGLKPIPGITRVTIVRSKNVIFVIKNPEVYKSPTSDSYIVFGEAKIEDMGMAAQAQAARKLRDAQGDDVLGSMESAAAARNKTPSAAIVEEPEDESEPIDEAGIDTKDIEMMMAQCHVSRRKAVKTLQEHDGDIVNAIMALTG